MGESGPEPVERDSRGILDPWLLRQRVQLTRYPAPGALAGLVDRFWAVRWDLPPGTVHQQQVLTHPGANMSVGNANVTPAARQPGPVEARLNGVARGLATRVLVGQGWAVAALTRPGGLGAFISGPAAGFTDRVVPLGPAIGVDEAALVGQLLRAAGRSGAGGDAGRCAGAGRGPGAGGSGQPGRRGRPAGRGQPGGPPAGRPVCAGRPPAAHPAADVLAVCRGVADLGDPPVPAAGGG